MTQVMPEPARAPKDKTDLEKAVDLPEEQANVAVDNN
jgi:hypothetical protein